MDKLLDNNVALQNMTNDVTNEVLQHLDAAGLAEIACAIILPLLALLIGIRINRWVDNRPKETLNSHVVDFVAPLLTPLFAVLFVMLAGFTFRYLETPIYILPFAWKLAVAWLAIQFVSMMSSRQSAGWVIALVIVPITLLHLFNIWEPVTTALEDMKFSIGKAKLNAYDILNSAAALIALFWVAGFVVSATDKRLRRVRSMHVSNRVLIMKIFQILLYFVVFLIGLQMLGIDLTAFSVLGGALGVGIGFGLQKIASNFISGIILLFEKSVQVDDLIQLSDGTTGFIRQTAARYTLVEVADGREILIPNEEFISQRVTTLTHSSHRGRVEIPVGVDYDADLALARKLLVEATKACSRTSKDPAPAAFISGFGDSAINMVLYLWVEDIAAGTLLARTEVMMEIVRLFKENNISIPYPHQVAVADPALDARFAALEERLETIELHASKAAAAAEARTPDQPKAKVKTV